MFAGGGGKGKAAKEGRGAGVTSDELRGNLRCVGRRQKSTVRNSTRLLACPEIPLTGVAAEAHESQKL